MILFIYEKLSEFNYAVCACVARGKMIILAYEDRELCIITQRATYWTSLSIISKKSYDLDTAGDCWYTKIGPSILPWALLKQWRFLPIQAHTYTSV